jgi:hypothetical protein
MLDVLGANFHYKVTQILRVEARGITLAITTNNYTLASKFIH